MRLSNCLVERVDDRVYLVNEFAVLLFLRVDLELHANVEQLHVCLYLVLLFLIRSIQELERLDLLDIALHVHWRFADCVNLLLEPPLEVVHANSDQLRLKKRVKFIGLTKILRILLKHCLACGVSWSLMAWRFTRTKPRSRFTGIMFSESFF